VLCSGAADDDAAAAAAAQVLGLVDDDIEREREREREKQLRGGVFRECGKQAGEGGGQSQTK
jgi:hypothetical protein